MNTFVAWLKALRFPGWNLVRESVKLSSDVSSMRIQGYIALVSYYGLWLAINIVAMVKEFSMADPHFTIIGLYETVGLTAAIIGLKIYQNKQENSEKKAGQ